MTSNLCKTKTPKSKTQDLVNFKLYHHIVSNVALKTFRLFVRAIFIRESVRSRFASRREKQSHRKAISTRVLYANGEMFECSAWTRVHCKWLKCFSMNDSKKFGRHQTICSFEECWVHLKVWKFECNGRKARWNPKNHQNWNIKKITTTSLRIDCRLTFMKC